MNVVAQRTLAADQIEAFYHEDFVEDQVRDFQSLMEDASGRGVVVDVGGGCGFLARRLGQAVSCPTRVIDTDPASIAACKSIGVDARVGNALAPDLSGDEGSACFNLILHHLVGQNEHETRQLQIAALKAWRRVGTLFVNEYIYESFIPRFSGRFIFEITSSQMLSFIGRQVGRIVPSLRANTFGVGVRFRSHDEWRTLFAEAGYRVVGSMIGQPEPISPPLRGLLIKTIRRDSFRLEPVGDVAPSL